MGQRGDISVYLTCFLCVKHIDHVDVEVPLQPKHVIISSVHYLQGISYRHPKAVVFYSAVVAAND